MRRLSMYFAVGAVLILVGQVLSTPMDRRAYDILEMVKGVLARDTDKQLSQTELASVLKASEIDSAVVRMAAAYALAFTDSEVGKKALGVLKKSNVPGVAGVAEFSVLRNQAAHLKGQKLLAVLSFRLGQSKRPWARTLLVSRLGDEFKGSTTPLFMAALEGEENALVRAELFFQIACHGNRDQLAKARLLLKQEKVDPARAFHESRSSFLNAVCRNPTQRTDLPAFIERLIESRMKATATVPGK